MPLAQLISTEHLQRRLGQDNLVVLDCRFALEDPAYGRRSYLDGHIPGAHFLDLEQDLSYSAGQISIRCSANQSKPGVEVLYGPDGAEQERIDDGYDFDAIAKNSLDSYIKDMLCDGQRSTTIYPSIRAFIEAEAGRPVKRIGSKDNAGGDDPRIIEFDQGYAAFHQGIGLQANPYERDRVMHLAWENGWCEARDDALRAEKWADRSTNI